MWHELSHVYVLNMTNSRVPRWFTEGLAVYEETAASPDWGDRLDPDAIKAIETKRNSFRFPTSIAASFTRRIRRR